MKEELICKMFGGPNSEQYNALMSAFVLCAKDSLEKEIPDIYEWLESTPKTTLVVQVVEKLIEMGYKISK